MKILSLLFFLVSSLSLIKAQDSSLLNENFSTGMPISWVQSGVSATSNNNKTCVSMGSNAYLITPELAKLGSLTFAHRASGNGKMLSVEKSVDGGEWVAIGNCSPSSSSGWGSSSFSVNDANDNVRIRFTASNGTIYITDIQLSALPYPVFKLGSGDPDFEKVFNGETSDSHAFSVTAMYLSGSVVVESSVINFELSSDNSNFSDQLIMPINSSGLLKYYIRFKSPSEEVGKVKGTIKISASGVDPLSFEVTAIAVKTEPTILVKPMSLNFGYVLYGDTSMVKSVIVESRYLEENTTTLSASVLGAFELATSENGPFGKQVELNLLSMQPLPLQLFVRFKPCCELINQYYSADVVLSGGGAQAIISVSGVGVTSMEGIARHYYISPLGNDATGDGSFTKPWYNLSKVIELAEAGDTIHCRGGVYNYNQTIRLSNSGTAKKRICIFAYHDDEGNWEKPIFDFTNQEYGSSNRAILILGDYWYFYGIHITKAGDNGIKLEGNHCVVERCVFSYNGDTGIQLGFGHDFSDSHPGVSKNNGFYCAYNIIVDCDSYQNYDQDNFGSDADGFACKMHNGLQNWFLRCRAWNNSDDAWDLYETDYPVYIIECWGFHSGDASQHLVSGGSFQGNGNGIKMGGNGSGGSSEGKHEAWYCVAFNNNKTNSVKGFDQNSHKGGVQLVNCLSYNNGYDFMFEDAPSGTTNDFYNNVCLSNRIEINASGSMMDHNVAINNPEKGWQNALNLTFSAADYGDLSEDAAKRLRAGNGDLPTGFARLISTSQLINQGLNGLECPIPNFLDQPLVGSALSLVQPVMGVTRDLGPYESNVPANVPFVLNEYFLKVVNLEQQGSLRVDYSLSSESGSINVRIFSIDGRLMRSRKIDELVNVKSCSIVESGFSSGVYIVQLLSKSKMLSQKITVP